MSSGISRSARVKKQKAPDKMLLIKAQKTEGRSKNVMITIVVQCIDKGHAAHGQV